MAERCEHRRFQITQVFGGPTSCKCLDCGADLAALPDYGIEAAPRGMVLDAAPIPPPKSWTFHLGAAPKPSTIVADFLRSLPGVKP